MTKIPPVLTIAGSDSSGGAGIQADLKTITALGCYGMTAITALTAQNTLGVQGIHPVPADFVTDQLSSIWADIPPLAVKVGMLHDAQLIRAVADFLAAQQQVPLVLDPVMVATSGDPLLDPTALEALQELLFPKASLITPNKRELELLTPFEIADRGSLQDAGMWLFQKWRVPILAKGGDLSGGDQSEDLLIQGDKEVHWFSADRIHTSNTHGTGCTLSSAIASLLALGNPLWESVSISKNFIQSAIYHGQNHGLGKGRGPVNHLWQIKGDSKVCC